MLFEEIITRYTLNWILYAVNSDLHHIVSGLKILTFQMKSINTFTTISKEIVLNALNILFLQKSNDLKDSFTIQSKESSSPGWNCSVRKEWKHQCRPSISSIVWSFKFYIYSYFIHLQLLYKIKWTPMPINRRTRFKLIIIINPIVWR